MNCFPIDEDDRWCWRAPKEWREKHVKLPKLNLGDTTMSWSFIKKAATKEEVKALVRTDPSMDGICPSSLSIVAALMASIDALDDNPKFDIQVESYGHIYQGIGNFMVKVEHKPVEPEQSA